MYHLFISKISSLFTRKHNVIDMSNTISILQEIRKNAELPKSSTAEPKPNPKPQNTPLSGKDLLQSKDGTWMTMSNPLNPLSPLSPFNPIPFNLFSPTHQDDTPKQQDHCSDMSSNQSDSYSSPSDSSSSYDSGSSCSDSGSSSSSFD